MFVKICGIKSLEELRVVEKYADATGVVVKCQSKRVVSTDLARELIRSSKIPVFVVSTLDSFKDWAEVIEKSETDHVQIHSDMSAGDIEKIRSEYGVRVIKAFRVPENCDNPIKIAEKLMDEIELYEVDGILLDNSMGRGMIHDLRISKIIAKRFDVILAGGLNPDNVAEIVEFVKPFGVDVSSGVESGNKKDEKKIRDFVKALGKL
uniref:N-(5'-phosphoribosyl)anthranilate isomerase n=1 Tax=Geoglobus ahangari TaxID=113653 RepID=A0A7C3UI89_9EURY